MKTTIKKWLEGKKFNWENGRVAVVSNAFTGSPDNVVLVNDHPMLDHEFEVNFKAKGLKAQCPSFVAEDDSQLCFPISNEGKSEILGFPKEDISVTHIAFLHLATPEGGMKRIVFEPPINVLVMPNNAPPNTSVYAGWIEAQVFMIGPTIELAIQALGQRMTLDYMYALEHNPDEDSYSQFVRKMFDLHKARVIEPPRPRIIRPGDKDFPANMPKPFNPKKVN